MSPWLIAAAAYLVASVVVTTCAVALCRAAAHADADREQLLRVEADLAHLPEVAPRPTEDAGRDAGGRARVAPRRRIRRTHRLRHPVLR